MSNRKYYILLNSFSQKQNSLTREEALLLLKNLNFTIRPTYNGHVVAANAKLKDSKFLELKSGTITFGFHDKYVDPAGYRHLKQVLTHLKVPYK